MIRLKQNVFSDGQESLGKRRKEGSYVHCFVTVIFALNLLVAEFSFTKMQNILMKNVVIFMNLRENFNFIFAMNISLCLHKRCQLLCPLLNSVFWWETFQNQLNHFKEVLMDIIHRCFQKCKDSFAWSLNMQTYNICNRYNYTF